MALGLLPTFNAGNGEVRKQPLVQIVVKLDVVGQTYEANSWPTMEQEKVVSQAVPALLTGSLEMHFSPARWTHVGVRSTNTFGGPLGRRMKPITCRMKEMVFLISSHRHHFWLCLCLRRDFVQHLVNSFPRSVLILTTNRKVWLCSSATLSLNTTFTKHFLATTISSFPTCP